MPVFGPISRRELIRALQKAGFEGPFSGGKHQFMSEKGRQNSAHTQSAFGGYRYRVIESPTETGRA